MHPARPSRRALLQAKLMAEPDGRLHISSAIVSVLPSRREEITRRLCTLNGGEIHHRESFKIVIVLEARDAGEIGGRLAEIATWRGVLSANMVFEQADGDGELT